MDGCKIGEDISFIFLLCVILGFDRERRGAQLSQLSSFVAKEMGLRLGEVHLLSDRDLLGHQAAAMGAKCKQ